ncbi:hypothetical protein COO91_06479 [Nostoc flagelliforme CCNUN1]|uniref:Uncharacterized protein n=1 Tax=Nostoc flagelliforme CCNUN1 TaxID=2038116 RepID=A0A2K8SYE4_9NOSO|nr:hypothetical protein COO91_06479 [Nostoc flagelliforme CCNUN1]
MDILRSQESGRVRHRSSWSAMSTTGFAEAFFMQGNDDAWLNLP